MNTKSLATALLICALAVFAAHSQSSKLIERHFKALAAHDVKAIAADYADSARIYSPNWEGAKAGPAGITEVYNRYFSSTPDLSYKVNDIIYAKGSAIAEYSSGGTLSNPENGTPDYMKGKAYSINYCAVFVIKDGKIVRESDYFDQVAFLKQVGFFDQH